MIKYKKNSKNDYIHNFIINKCKGYDIIIGSVVEPFYRVEYNCSFELDWHRL